MANYIASSRTNYFRVKDEEAFKTWAAKFGFQVWTNEGYPGHFALGPNEMDDNGTFSLYDPDNEDENEDEPDLVTELAKHLEPGSVAVLMEAGAEKLRYVVGNAVAFDHTGELVQVNLNEIYALAKSKFGVSPTAAEY